MHVLSLTRIGGIFMQMSSSDLTKAAGIAMAVAMPRRVLSLAAAAGYWLWLR